MCRIEQFDVVYPSRARERREQVVPCRRGTRSQPCRHAEVVNLEDRFASASDLRPRMQPHIIPIEPSGLESSRPRSSGREKPRGPIEGLALNFSFWNPFSSKRKEKKEKPKYYFVRRTKKPQPRPTVIQYQPPIPPPHETHFATPLRGEPPIIIPIQPPSHHATHRRPEREPRGRRRPNPVVIHHPSEEDEDESPSPPEASREHRRRTRSLSPISRYEAEKEVIRLREFRERERLRELRETELRERELRDRERRERTQREEREARERAKGLAIHERLERQREREEQLERQQRSRQEHREFRQRERIAIEREVRRQQEERDREDARILQEREDHDRLQAADRARQREERARRHQEEDYEHHRAAELNRLRRLRDEQARRQYAEQQRLARALQANIPRPPHHPVFVHQNEGHLDRGDRFIQDAITAENLRLFERRARWSRGGYDDGALRRRNTIDGDRGRYDGQRRRRERR